MELHEFIDEVIERLRVKLGEDYEVSYNEVLKNNSSRHKGVIIRRKNEDSAAAVSPAIYLESFFEDYNEGEEFDSIVESILSVYHQCNSYRNILNSDSISKEKLSERIFYRLVNLEMNKELLSDSPYLPFMDLAVTFHYMCSCDSDMIQSFRIKDSLVEEWKLDIDDMFTMANDNMSVLFPDNMLSMRQMASRYPRYYTDGVELNFAMYVLTNSYYLNGAAAMLYTTKIQQLAAEYDMDMFILPSSIHEVIIVPAYKELDGAALRNMVREINSKYVMEEERLSDEVYLFSNKTGKIKIYT